MNTTVTLNSKNQIVVPQQARELLNIGPGQELLVLARPDRLVLIPKPADFVQRLSGLHRSVWDELGVLGYLKEERESWDC